MNRRDSLKTLMASAGTLAVLPTWARQWTRETVPPLQGAFGATGQQALTAITDTIIPPGNAIGALSVGVDKFLVGLLENCYEEEVRQNVHKQIAVLNTRAQAAHQKDFASLDQSQREALLMSFARSEDKAEKDFFELMKSETIRGFNTSKEVMMGYLKYKMVPGHYYGCVDATS